MKRTPKGPPWMNMSNTEMKRWNGQTVLVVPGEMLGVGRKTRVLWNYQHTLKALSDLPVGIRPIMRLLVADHTVYVYQTVTSVTFKNGNYIIEIQAEVRDIQSNVLDFPLVASPKSRRKCTKLAYASEKQARKARAALIRKHWKTEGFKLNMRGYECPKCGMHHLTTQTLRYYRRKNKQHHNGHHHHID